MPDSIIPGDWVAKAQADLRSARVLRSASPPLLEQAIHLAAQAAEKIWIAIAFDLVTRRILSNNLEAPLRVL